MENIYKLLPSADVEIEQKLKYTSIHSQNVKNEMAATKSPGKLFGPGSSKPDPKNFTKKGVGETIRAKNATGPLRVDLATVPATVLAPSVQPRPDLATMKYVPRHTERPTIAPKSNKNFLKTNIQDATKRSTSKSSPKPMHTMGEVPKYLTKRKEETMKAEQMSYSLKRQQEEHNRMMKQISADEREDLLSGLKANYKDLYTSYLGLSVVTDTIPKRNTKNSMEAKLAELEADIAKLERHQVILIQD